MHSQNEKNIDTLVGEMQVVATRDYPKYDPRLESALAQIAKQPGIVAKDELRFYAIKLFERDEQIQAESEVDAKRQEKRSLA